MSHLQLQMLPPLLYPGPRGSCHGTTEEILLFKCLCSFSFCTILGDLESTTNICEGGLERLNLSQKIHRGLIARAPVPHRKEQQHSSLLPHYRLNACRCRHVELHGQTANQEKPLLALLLLRALSRQRQSTRHDQTREGGHCCDTLDRVSLIYGLVYGEEGQSLELQAKALDGCK